MNTNNIFLEPVSEDIRKQNSYYCNKLKKWRFKYKSLSENIRDIKRTIKLNEQEGFVYYANQHRVVLSTLQREAVYMMNYRDFLTERLKATAYRYV